MKSHKKKSGLIIALVFITFALKAANITSTPSDCDTLEVKKQYSILAEYMKQKNYELAFPAWRYVYQCAPNKYQGLYVWGNELLKIQIKNAKDEKEKAKYIDSLFMLHNKRIELSGIDAKKFGSKGDNLGKKGMDWIAYYKDSTETAYKIFKECASIQGSNVSAAVIVQYMVSSYNMLVAKKLECLDIVNLYAELSDICDKNFNEKKDSNYVKAMVQVDKFAERCLDCGSLLESYGKSFEANKSNIDWLQKASTNLDKRECSKRPEHKANPVLGQIFEAYAKLTNTADAYNKYAMFLVSNDKVKEAEEYMEKAAELETDKDKKAKYYLNLASINAEAKKYSEARALAKKAAANRENWGDPYILIGDLYAATSCGDTECNRGGPMWAAADKYNYAKTIDPSCADKANARLSRVMANYPLQGGCFFDNIKDGTPYTVGCWINENTTVRTKKE